MKRVIHCKRALLFGLAFVVVVLWVAQTLWVARQRRQRGDEHGAASFAAVPRAGGGGKSLHPDPRRDSSIPPHDKPSDHSGLSRASPASKDTATNRGKKDSRRSLKKNAPGTSPHDDAQRGSKKGPKNVKSPRSREDEPTRGAVEVNPISRNPSPPLSMSTVNAGGSDNVPYWETPGPFAPLAYLIIISNEDFLDGALVMGTSLRNHSAKLQRGEADLAIIITQGRVSRPSQERLLNEGGFNKIFEVPSLAKRAPGAYWKDTFDKIYMFNLTMYRKIIFGDADMICVQSMDALFDKNFGDSTYVGAIGFRGGAEGPYFQTGMMVIQPTRTMFDKIFARFESGVPPRGNMYNHGMNGRDGVLLRDVFGDRFKMIDNKYSRNLNPRWPIPDYVVSLHLRGKVKPWFDRRLPNLDPELGKKEFGHSYVLFWEIYERDIHKKGLFYQLALKGEPLPEPFGGKFAAPDVTPLTHVWMMRYSSKEYVQLLTEEDRRRRNISLPGLEYKVGKVNESCVEVCASAGKNCSHQALYFSHAQDCSVLREAFHHQCTRCELGVYWRPHPGSDYPGMDHFKGEKICKYNLLFDERGRPNCTARYEHAQRLCPCVPIVRE